MSAGALEGELGREEAALEKTTHESLKGKTQGFHDAIEPKQAELASWTAPADKRDAERLRGYHVRSSPEGSQQVERTQTQTGRGTFVSRRIHRLLCYQLLIETIIRSLDLITLSDLPTEGAVGLARSLRGAGEADRRAACAAQATRTNDRDGSAADGTGARCATGARGACGERATGESGGVTGADAGARRSTVTRAHNGATAAAGAAAGAGAGVGAGVGAGAGAGAGAQQSGRGRMMGRARGRGEPSVFGSPISIDLLSLLSGATGSTQALLWLLQGKTA